MKITEYRCTRPDLYPAGSPGHTDSSARQGYYIWAIDEDHAAFIMGRRFPDETIEVISWKELPETTTTFTVEDIPEMVPLIRLAKDIQDACNLSGVIHSFSQVMTKLWEVNNKYNMGGTAWVNSNTVTRMFASKIVSLTGETTVEDFL